MYDCMEREPCDSSRHRSPLLLLHQYDVRRRWAWHDGWSLICAIHRLLCSKMMGGARARPFLRWWHQQVVWRSEAHLRPQSRRPFSVVRLWSMVSRRMCCRMCCAGSCDCKILQRRVLRTSVELLRCAQGSWTHLACGSMRLKSCLCRFECQCAVGEAFRERVIAIWA